MEIFASFATAVAAAILSIPVVIPDKIPQPQSDQGSLAETLAIPEDFEMTIGVSEIGSAEYIPPKEPPKILTESFPTVGTGFLGAPQYVVDIATSASARTGMPVALILAQLKKESGFSPRAVSPTNDHGIAQIHFPKPGVTLEQAYDPSFAINWQVNVMSNHYRTYGSWRDALAAYNAGTAGRERGLGYGYADTVLRMAGL